MTLAKLALESGVVAGDHWVTVPAAKIRQALAEAKEEGYDFFSFITCVDHLARADGEPPFGGAGSRFEIVYQLRDLSRRRQIRIRAFLPADNPSIDSAHDLFGPANWDERETFDLFGIDFKGHPDLTRILMPDEWVGHPLRRDYPVGGDPVDFSQDHEEWQTRPSKA